MFLHIHPDFPTYEAAKVQPLQHRQVETTLTNLDATNSNTPANNSRRTGGQTGRRLGRLAAASGIFAGGMLAGGLLLGAGAFAAAGGGAGFGGHGFAGHGARIGMIQHVVRSALDSVGATTAQEDKIHDIFAKTFTDLDASREGAAEMRKKTLDLLRAPTIDKAAVEKLRVDEVAGIDAKSKTIVGALLDAADQLTPDQRAKLVQRMEDRMAARRGWGGHRDGMPDRGFGPDGAPGGDRTPSDHG